jgi:hypothetical protein
MVDINGYVHNRAHLEGSMIEGYTTEVVIECCIDYIKDGKPICVLVSRHYGRLNGKGTKGHESFNDGRYERVCKTHFSIMHQLAVTRPYIEKHLIMKQHKLHFTPWLKDLNIHVGEIPKEKNNLFVDCWSTQFG